MISKREWHADAAACPKGKLPSMIQESNLEGVGDIEVMSIISLIAPSTNARVGAPCLAMIEPRSRCSSQKRQVRILVCISCHFSVARFLRCSAP